MADNESKVFEVEDENGEMIKTVSASEFEILKAQIKEKDALLAKKADEERNFEALRKSKEHEEDEKKKVESDAGVLATRLLTLEKEREDAKTREKTQFDARNKESFSAMSGGDKDLEGKIEFFFGRFAGDISTEQERQERLENAYLLAKRKPMDNANFSRGTSASGSSYVPSPKADTFDNTPEGIEFAKKLGLKYVNNLKK